LPSGTTLSVTVSREGAVRLERQIGEATIKHRLDG
jgi:hypothetical protein